MSLQTALLGADEAYLVGMSNKGLYKRAVKDLSAADGAVTYQDDTAEVTICGETCHIRDPLWESSCTCPSRSICRHVLTAILWLKEHTEPIAAAEPTETLPQPPVPEPSAVPAAQTKPPAEEEPIRECAAAGLSLLSDVLRWGLVRLPESMADHFETAAVRCHNHRMAEAENLLRDFGNSLKNCRERRAVFRTESFLSLLSAAAQHLQLICSEPVTEELLGTFRSAYEDYRGELRLLPIGGREILSDEFEGQLWYFLNLDESAERRFLVYSEMIRRTGEQRRSHRNSLAPWGAGMTMEKFMHQQVTLIGAKTSGSKLSSSKETQIVTRTEANLNCKEVRSLIQQDFRETAVWLGAQEGEEEKLCLICAERCLASRFDSHAQQLRMTMTDAAGNHADLRVNYRKETKEFIEQLEHIGKLMLEKPETPYVWLCSARFEGGELVFFPIEVFNFIEPPPPKPFHLPPQYTAKENAKAPLILELFDEITEYMGELVQCGIQSAQDGSGRRLAKKAEQCGMEGLSGLITELGTQAEGFRHSMHSGTAAALTALVQLQRYLSIGRRKSAVITALNSMQSKL